MDEVGGALLAIALVLCGGVHPGGPDLRHPGPVLPPVRGHHRRLDPDLVPGLAHPLAGPVRAAAQAARGAPQAARALTAPIRWFFNGFNWLFDRLAVGLRRAHPPADPAQRAGARRLWRPDRARRLPVPARAHRLHPRAGPGLPDHRDPAAAGLLAWSGPTRSSREATKLALSVEGTAHTAGFAGFDGATFTNAPNAGADLRHAQAVRGAGRRRASPRTTSCTTCAPSWARCRRRSSWSSTRRRCAASARAAASSSMSRTGAAAACRRSEAVTNELVARANQEPGLTSVFTLFNTRTPKVYADIDRAKAEMLGVPVEQRVRHAQRLSGLVLRQRLQLSRPHLPGAGPGRRPVPPRGRATSPTSRPGTRAATWCRWARSPPSRT